MSANARPDGTAQRGERGDTDRPSRVLVGGVGYRWQRDASFGLVVTDDLARRQLPAGVEAMDLGYGAIYAAQDLADARPPYTRVIFVAGTQRDREPGRIYRYQWREAPAVADEIQERMREAGAGVLDLDHLLVIARFFNGLPGDVVLIELEPVDAGSGDGLSPAVAALLPEAMDLVLHEALAPPAGAPHDD